MAQKKYYAYVQANEGSTISGTNSNGMGTQKTLYTYVIEIDCWETKNNSVRYAIEKQFKEHYEKKLKEADMMLVRNTVWARVFESYGEAASERAADMEKQRREKRLVSDFSFNCE